MVKSQALMCLLKRFLMLLEEQRERWVFKVRQVLKENKATFGCLLSPLMAKAYILEIQRAKKQIVSQLREKKETKDYKEFKAQSDPKAIRVKLGYL